MFKVLNIECDIELVVGYLETHCQVQHGVGRGELRGPPPPGGGTPDV